MVKCHACNGRGSFDQHEMCLYCEGSGVQEMREERTMNRQAVLDVLNSLVVLWGPIDDELRYRVLNGEGTAMDAERLLRALEPEVFGQ